MRRTDPSFPARADGQHGFSLVEMLVALVFMMVLMGGLASVFKASLSSYVTGAETTSSRRQNREALEVLFDDLNQAGMTASSLTSAPTTVTSANPPFYVIPNQPYANTDVPNAAAPVNGGQNAWAVTDQLVLYYERFLPYETTMGSPLNSTAQGVANGTTLANALTGGLAITIKFNDANQAALAAQDFTTANASGMGMNLVSSGTTLAVTGLTANVGAATATATFTANQPIGATVPKGSVVSLVAPNQYVCYSIKPMLLDPSNPATFTPCLVRDVIAYPANGTVPVLPPWAPTISSSIVAENVTGFHVGLSANGGATWAGINPATGTWSTTTAAWADLTGPSTGAASPTLNFQLNNFDTTAAPLPSVASGGVFWFRTYPVLLRLDIQTRTVKTRSEYGPANTALTAADAYRFYNYQTRTMIINPRHFGLAY